MIGKLAVLAAILGGVYAFFKLYNRETARVEKKVSEAARREAEQARTVDLELDPESGKYRARDDEQS